MESGELHKFHCSFSKRSLSKAFVKLERRETSAFMDAKRFDMFDKVEDSDQDNEPTITDDGQVTIETYAFVYTTNSNWRHML